MTVKTCTKCGTTKAESMFRPHRRTCRECEKSWRRLHPERAREHQRRYQARALERDPDFQNRRMRKWHADHPAASAKEQAKRQADSLRTAERNGTIWASWELEIIADYSRSTRELAAMLGRTYCAVKNRRAMLRRDPATIAHAGLSESGRL